MYILTASVSLAVLVGLFCGPVFRDTLNVMDELKATVGALEREDGMGSISVQLMDPNVAEIYAKSPRSHVSVGVRQRRWGRDDGKGKSLLSIINRVFSDKVTHYCLGHVQLHTQQLQPL